MTCANRARGLGALGVALLVGVAGAACGEGTDAPPATTSGPTAISNPTTTSTSDHPEPVLRIYRTGGMTSPRSRWLGLALYADGRVVLPPAEGKDPAYEPLTVSRMPAADVTALTGEAARVVKPDVYYDGVRKNSDGSSVMVSDAQVTWVQRWDGQRYVTTSAYALAEMTTPDSQALATFVAKAEGEAKALPVEGDVTPAALEVWARPSLAQHPYPSNAKGPDLRPWPGEPLTQGSGTAGEPGELTCHVETDPAPVLAAVAKASPDTAWVQDGTSGWFSVELVPLLAGERGCPTDTPANPG